MIQQKLGKIEGPMYGEWAEKFINEMSFEGDIAFGYKNKCISDLGRDVSYI